MREFINIVEGFSVAVAEEDNGSRDSHYMPLEPLFKDKRGGSSRKYRLNATGETLVVSIYLDEIDEDGDTLYSATSYIFKDGSMKAIGNGRIVARDGEAYFSNIGVIPEYRRLGVATAMYDQVEDMGYALDMSPGDVFPDARNMWHYRNNRA